MNTTILNVLLFIGGMVAQCILSAFLAYHREAKAKREEQIATLFKALEEAQKIIQERDRRESK